MLTLLGVVVTIITTSLLHNLLLTIAADDDPLLLESDKKHLLVFSNALPIVGRKVDWNPEDKAEDICKWVGITCTHDMEDNSLSGKGRTTKPNRVGAINLPAKNLYGPIAAKSIGKLDALEILHLKHNLLYGSIPPDIFNISSLISINLQDNRLCGDLPNFRYFPPKLQIVDWSKNYFTGQITPIFHKTTKLLFLNLSFNLFSGNIPPFEELKKLDKLDLSHNQLNGQIPLPFQKFPLNSFVENPSLCGKPVSEYCPMLPPAYPPSITAAYSNKLGAIALLCSSTILLLIL